MNKKACISWIRKLNKHFNRKVKLRTDRDTLWPYADPVKETIFVPPEPASYDPRIITQEYAHILWATTSYGNWYDKEFRAYFLEACMALGAFSMGLSDLRTEVRRGLETQDISGFQPTDEDNPT